MALFTLTFLIRVSAAQIFREFLLILIGSKILVKWCIVSACSTYRKTLDPHRFLVAMTLQV